MGGPCPESCPTVGFGIRGAEPSGFVNSSPKHRQSVPHVVQVIGIPTQFYTTHVHISKEQAQLRM